MGFWALVEGVHRVEVVFDGVGGGDDRQGPEGADGPADDADEEGDGDEADEEEDAAECGVDEAAVEHQGDWGEDEGEEVFHRDHLTFIREPPGMGCVCSANLFWGEDARGKLWDVIGELGTGFQI